MGLFVCFSGSGRLCVGRFAIQSRLGNVLGCSENSSPIVGRPACAWHGRVFAEAERGRSARTWGPPHLRTRELVLLFVTHSRLAKRPMRDLGVRAEGPCAVLRNRANWDTSWVCLCNSGVAFRRGIGFVRAKSHRYTSPLRKRNTALRMSKDAIGQYQRLRFIFGCY